MTERKSRNATKGILVGKAEFLKAKPLRHPDSTWEEDERGLHVEIPQKRNSFARFLSKFLPIARKRRVLLDKQGALVWSLCDGEHQIKEIARKLGERYNLRVSDAEAALDLYFVQLSKNGFVGFVLSESAKKRYYKNAPVPKKTKKENG